MGADDLHEQDIDAVFLGAQAQPEYLKKGGAIALAVLASSFGTVLVVIARLNFFYYRQLVGGG